MKNIFKIAAAVAVAAPFTGAIAADNADVMAKLQQLEAIVQQQQAEITALRGDNTTNRALVADLVQEEIDAALDARIEEGLAAIKDSSSLSLGAGIDGLAITGDARFRYEKIDDVGATADGDSYGVRLRVGGVWTNKSDDTQVGVGVTLGAGRASDSMYGAPGAFGSDNLNLDYAYATHNMDAFSVTIGQMINPFVTSDILWDEDVRPVGIVAGFEDAGFFATAGVLNYNDISEGTNGNGAEALITAGQVGFKSDGEDANYSLALGYYHGNAELANDVAGAGDTSYDVQILDVVGSFNTTAGDIGLGIHGHYAINFGADGAVGTGQMNLAGQNPDDNDQAYAIGITAGLEKLSAGYTYKHIESDSVIGALNDNDFGRGISSANVEGHEFGVGYAISDNIDLGLNVFLYEQVEGTADGELYQLDLSYQF